MHDLFHVRMLKKYTSDLSYIIKYELIIIDKKLSYVKNHSDR